jgi:hypothetical protein
MNANYFYVCSVYTFQYGKLFSLFLVDAWHVLQTQKIDNFCASLSREIRLDVLADTVTQFYAKWWARYDVLFAKCGAN